MFVQARAMFRADGPEEMRPVGETEFVNGVAAMSASGIYGKTKVCAGIVGHADLDAGRARRAGARGPHRAPAATASAASATSPPGTPIDVVRNPAYSPPPGLLADKTFREGFAVLGRLGLSFDAWLYHPQIDELTDLARAFPETRIVLNHVGGPIGIGAYAGKREEVFAGWAASIQALAACPNVLRQARRPRHAHRRLRLPREAASRRPRRRSPRRGGPTSRPASRPSAPSRCMFESNFPVDKGSYSYPVFWNACKLLAKGASAAEKADLFAGTATALLPPRRVSGHQPFCALRRRRRARFGSRASRQIGSEARRQACRATTRWCSRSWSTGARSRSTAWRGPAAVSTLQSPIAHGISSTRL